MRRNSLWNSINAFRSHAIAVAPFLFLLAIFVHAQNSQFFFDDNGNLAAQMGDTIAPPQITGQAQNQVLAAGKAAGFSVVVSDPRAPSRSPAIRPSILAK